MAKIKMTAQDRADRKAQLIDHLQGITTIYTIVRKVAASGMSREISLLAVKNGEIMDITWGACVAMDASLNKGGNAIIVKGCGMDLCWHTVERLSQTLGLKLSYRML